MIIFLPPEQERALCDLRDKIAAHTSRYSLTAEQALHWCVQQAASRFNTPWPQLEQADSTVVRSAVQDEIARWMHGFLVQASDVQPDDGLPPETEDEPDESDPAIDTLADQTVAELRALAEVEGIDLTGLTRKADIIQAIVHGQYRDTTEDSEA